ncbi:hypothetical protein M378DRAFT_39058, partial [Amanita muscaria Koide BX008]
HASARNVVERIIGILKQRFQILYQPPKYSMDIQVLIPSALCALHNAIRRYDPDEITLFDDNTEVLQPGHHDQGSLAEGQPNQDVRERANARRDQIAQQMWDDY